MRYNLACSLSDRLDDRGLAIEVMEPYFERAVSSTLIRHLDADPDMDPIRDDPRFQELLAAAKQRLGIAA
jgi:adenylate cyclase